MKEIVAAPHSPDLDNFAPSKSSPHAPKSFFNHSLFVKTSGFLFIAAALLLLLAGQARAAQLKTPYATIQFENRDALRDFNHKIECKYESGFCLGSNLLLEASAGLLISTMVEDIEKLLDMYPQNLQFHIEVLASPKDVKNIYQALYGKEKDYIAFYSPRNGTIYVAASSLKRSVLIHEMAHAIIDRYFDRSPPVKIHELLAQYVEGEL